MLTASHRHEVLEAESFGVAPSAARRSATAPGVDLLEAVPALRAAVPPEDHALARRILRAPAVTCDAGALALPAPTDPGRPSAAVVVRGAVVRETALGDRSVGELLGAPDVIEIDRDDDDSSWPTQTRYVAREPTVLAVLDERFALAARRWPELHEVVGAQRARQARRASRHLAALSLPRVEDRLAALFCDLADRWGRVTPAGIRIDMALTHALIGQLVGARRPTVSLALADLAASGALRRDGQDCWVLTVGSPAAA